MPQFGKIFLRFLDPRKPPERRIVFETIQKKLKLPLTGLREARNGLNAFTEFEQDIDILLTTDAKELLNKIGLEAKLTPKVKANRSVICRQVDTHVGTHDKDELKQEINRCNAHLQVAEIVKFGQYTHIFKIEFHETEMANQVLENGLLCYNVKISPGQIQKEEYVDILMCFKCYKLESHSTKNCPTPDIVICSECSGAHDYRDCTEATKKCINCKGAHRTMAMSCPVKKEMIKNKKNNNEEEKKKKEETTYARIVEKTIENVQLKQQTKTEEKITEEQGIRAFVIILDAHLRNIIAPGTYQKELNETLKLNGIAPIKVKEVNSNKLLGHNMIGKLLLNLKKNLERTLTESESSEYEMEIIEQDTQEDEIIERHEEKMETFCRSADDLDVEIYVRGEVNKRKNLEGKEIKDKFNSQELKYKILENSKYNQDEIENYIQTGRLCESKENIKYVSNSEFRKIRNGFVRTPAKDESKKKKIPKK
jgi:hypothetical protein